MSHGWHAASYERMSAPLEAIGREMLDRLDLRGDERVLDACCGTGRVTAALHERLPRGAVVAVDGSPAMIEAARERLGDAVELRVADLLELHLDEPVDAILRPPPSTGSPTTTRSSPGCARTSSPAAGWSPSAAEPATSTR